MTLFTFHRLVVEHQLALIFDVGTYLTTRWATHYFVDLYSLPDGLYAEVAYDAAAGRVVLVDSFDDASPRQPYPAPVSGPLLARKAA